MATKYFLIVLVLIGIAFLVKTAKPPVPSGVCTMDAKICSDGSAVGRIPPDCNFAPCPEE